MAEESERQKAQKWKCPECGQTVTLFIQPSAPPTCNNPSSHPNKYFAMEMKKPRGS